MSKNIINHLFVFFSVIGPFITGKEEIDVNKKYGKYSRFLIWGKNGRFNIENAVKRLIKAVERGKELPEITLEDIYRINYENDLEFHIGNV